MRENSQQSLITEDTGKPCRRVVKVQSLITEDTGKPCWCVVKVQERVVWDQLNRQLRRVWSERQVHGSQHGQSGTTVPGKTDYYVHHYLTGVDTYHSRCWVCSDHVCRRLSLKRRDYVFTCLYLRICLLYCPMYMYYVHTTKLSLRAAVVANRSITASMLGCQIGGFVAS